MLPNPSFVAWQKSGSPDVLTKYQKYIVDGQCSLCGAKGSSIPVKRVVSFKFTNWDDYSSETLPLWCEACTWGFFEKDNRAEACFITPHKVYRGYQVQSMKKMFLKALSENECISVALRKNKHVLPYASWGTVRIEDMNFTWGNREVSWLENMIRLLGLGFALGDIKKDSSPTFGTVLKLSADETTEAYKLWESIEECKKLNHIFNFIVELNKAVSMDYKELG